MAVSKKKHKKKKIKKSNVLNNVSVKDLKKFTQIKVKEQIQNEIERNKIKVLEATYEDIFINLLGVPLLALRNKGWGGKRLGEFYQEMMTIFKDYHQEWLSSQDMAEVISKETGFDLLKEKQDFIEWLRSIDLGGNHE
ncbi:hypothetical protein ACWOBL_06080 [Gemella bergeri]